MSLSFARPVPFVVVSANNVVACSLKPVEPSDLPADNYYMIFSTNRQGKQLNVRYPVEALVKRLCHSFIFTFIYQAPIIISTIFRCCCIQAVTQLLMSHMPYSTPCALPLTDFHLSSLSWPRMRHLDPSSDSVPSVAVSS